MAMFSNDVRVVNTATPAFHTDPNVTQYGWTKSDAAYYNQLIQYVDEARQIYVEISEKVIYFDTVLGKLEGLADIIDFMSQKANDVAEDAREVRAATAYVSNTKAAIDIMYRNMTADFAIFNSKYADFTVKYADVLEKAYATQLAAERAEKAYAGSKELYDDLKAGQVYRGTWNPEAMSPAAYPDGGGTNSTWDVVLNRGTDSFNFDSKEWRGGDRLIYVLSTKEYIQIETGSGVLSVNGKTGVVTLIADDVKAAPDGFGLGESGQSLSGKSCNDALKGGFYSILADTKDTPYGTGPSGSTMIVASWATSGAGISQMFFSYTSDRVHFRRRSSSVWQSWREIYHTGRIPTAADIGALSKTGDSLMGNFQVGTAGEAFVTKIGGRSLIRAGSTNDNVIVGNTDGQVFLDVNAKVIVRTRATGTVEHEVYHEGNLPSIPEQGGLEKTEAEALPATGTGKLMRVGGIRDEEIRSALAGATGGAYMSETPPPNPFPGARWFDTNEGRTYLWYVDVDSGQWVEENPQSADLVDGSPRLIKLADEGILNVALNKKSAITVNNGSSISYQDSGHAVFHTFAEGNGLEWSHGNLGENTIMTLNAAGVLNTAGAVFADNGFVCQSPDHRTWVSIEAADGSDPYLATRSQGEASTAKTVEFQSSEVKFNKRVGANHTRVGADGGLQFAPTSDLSGITWGMGVNASSRTLGVYQYSNGAYVGAVWDADSARNTHFHAGLSTQGSFLCRGGSESTYHQVRNGGNPTVELHEPGIAATMIYKPQGTSTVRFAQSNGAGGESIGYGGVDVDGFFTTSGRYRSVYQAANRSWTAVGSTPFYAEGISVGNGSFRSIAGGYSVIPGQWSLESTYGVYCETSPETTSHVLQMTDGGGFNRFWRFTNGGALYSPTNWSMSADGTLIGTVFGGYSSMINWCVGSFAPISDVKLKKNIQPSTRSALENVAKIKFHSYDWVDGKTKSTNLGMVAQELEQIDSSYAHDIETFKPDGSVDTSVKVLDTANLLALALKSIQELEARIKELEVK